MLNINSYGARSGKDEASLVAAAQSGDQDAFEFLVERHRRMVLFCTMRLTDNLEDAEDVVQQCFQKAFVHLKGFQRRSSFSTWLIRIARNEALMLGRSRRRWREISIAESREYENTPALRDFPDSGPTPEEIFQQERQRLLLLAMSQLRPHFRTVLRFCDLDERPVREAARILGLSISSAKSRVSRGRRVLRDKFRRLNRTQRRSHGKQVDRVKQ